MEELITFVELSNAQYDYCFVIGNKMLLEQDNKYSKLYKNKYYAKHPAHSEVGQRHFHIYDELENKLFSINIDGTFHDGTSFVLNKGMLDALNRLGVNTNNIDPTFIK